MAVNLIYLLILIFPEYYDPYDSIKYLVFIILHFLWNRSKFSTYNFFSECQAPFDSPFPQIPQYKDFMSCLTAGVIWGKIISIVTCWSQTHTKVTACEQMLSLLTH